MDAAKFLRALLSGFLILFILLFGKVYLNTYKLVCFHANPFDKNGAPMDVPFQYMLLEPVKP